MAIVFVGIDLAKTLRSSSPLPPVGQAGQDRRRRRAAICEAMQRPNMHFVPVKSLEQQALLTLHRVR